MLKSQIIAVCFVAMLSLHATRAFASEVRSVTIKRVASTPSLNDFSGMQPSDAIAHTFTKIVGFTQRDPEDGRPASEQTEVYLGYDNRNL